jgi:hypothetical protein
VPAPVEDGAGPNAQRAEDAIAERQAAVERGDGVARLAVDEDQWKRRNASVPLVPPKPNELESATSIFISRAVWGT